MKSLVVWFIGFLVLIHGHSFQSPAYADTISQQNSVAGQVIDVQTQLPIARALVSLEGSPGQTGTGTQISQKTDRLGRFRFEFVKPGTYQIAAMRDGFLAPTFPQGQTRVQIPESDQPVSKDVLLSLRPMSVIAGRVADEASDPVMGVEVTALRPELKDGKARWVPAGASVTNDRGEYRIPKLTPGRYLVKATIPWSSSLNRAAYSERTKPGRADVIYVDTWYPRATEEMQAVRLDVSLGAEVAGADIYLAPMRTFRIRGKVTMPGGAGAVLQWERADTGKRVIDGHLSAQRTSFELRGMLPGSYVLSAEPEDSEETGLARAAVQVIDDHIDSVAMLSQPPVAVRGSVLLDGEVPDRNGPRPDLRGISIRLLVDAIYFVPKVPVGDDFGFVIPKVQRTHFLVEVDGLPKMCYLDSIRYGEDEITLSGAEVTPGRAIQVLLKSKGGELAGSLHDDAGQPRSGVPILVTRDETSASGPMTGVTDDSGLFTFSSLKPGSYKLYLLDDARLDSLTTSGSRNADFGAPMRTVTVNAGSRETVSLVVK